MLKRPVFFFSLLFLLFFFTLAVYLFGPSSNGGGVVSFGLSVCTYGVSLQLSAI